MPEMMMRNKINDAEQNGVVMIVVGRFPMSLRSPLAGSKCTHEDDSITAEVGVMLELKASELRN